VYKYSLSIKTYNILAIAVRQQVTQAVAVRESIIS